MIRLCESDDGRTGGNTGELELFFSKFFTVRFPGFGKASQNEMTFVQNEKRSLLFV